MFIEHPVCKIVSFHIVPMCLKDLCSVPCSLSWPSCTCTWGRRCQVAGWSPASRRVITGCPAQVIWAVRARIIWSTSYLCNSERPLDALDTINDVTYFAGNVSASVSISEYGKWWLKDMLCFYKILDWILLIKPKKKELGPDITPLRRCHYRHCGHLRQRHCGRIR